MAKFVMLPFHAAEKVSQSCNSSDLTFKIYNGLINRFLCLFNLAGEHLEFAYVDYVAPEHAEKAIKYMHGVS